jgi:thiol:disulfide interchange protein
MNPENAENIATSPNRLRNLIVAIAAIILTTALFLGIQTQRSSTSLNAVATAALPIDVALNNDRPTLIEFYADWCKVCQGMAADTLSLQQEFGDRLNFVMLNVDNTKWLPELTKYRVDGIPRFIFLDSTNQLIGDAVGEIPRSIMAANLEASIAHQDLPYNNINGDRASAVNNPPSADISQPRDHSK